MKMNGIQFYNCLPKLVGCSQEEQYAVETQHGLPKILGLLKMSNFNICVVHLGFGAF